MELSDGVVRLREFRDDDAPWIAVACRDEETQRWLPLPNPYTEDDARAYIAMCDDAWREGNRFPFAIVDAASGDPLGSIDVRLGEVGSIGYWIRPEARDRGVATRALELLSRWALTERGVERLELTTDPLNTASQRIAEKAGFTREGVLRARMRARDGRRNAVMFSLLPSDLG